MPAVEVHRLARCSACGIGRLRRCSVKGTPTWYRGVTVIPTVDAPARRCDHCREYSVHAREVAAFDAVLRSAYEARRVAATP